MPGVFARVRFHVALGERAKRKRWAGAVEKPARVTAAR